MWTLNIANACPFSYYQYYVIHTCICTDDHNQLDLLSELSHEPQPKKKKATSKEKDSKEGHHPKDSTQQKKCLQTEPAKDVHIKCSQKEKPTKDIHIS